MLLRIFLFITLVSFISQPITAQKKNRESIVFSVDGKPVSTDELVYLYRKNHQSRPEEFTREKIEEYFDLFVNFKLKVAEARSRGLDTTAAFRKEFNSYRDELRKPYLPDSKLLDSLVRLTYERMKEDVNASHILVAVKADATPADTLEAYNRLLVLRNRVMNGEDFNTLAQQVSEDPSARQNKGKLGYFSAMQMVYAFENAAYQTTVGSVSMPVKTRFGYHILKVHERRPSQGEVEVSHILIRTGENKDNAQSKNTIFEIYDQLQHGADWNELCKQYSEDPSSKENGGKIRPFGRGVMISTPTFEEAAFALKTPGEISDPVETQWGWHIIKLEKKIPLQSFEAIAPSLKNRVSRDERVQLSKQAVYSKLKRENGFTEDFKVKSGVFNLADSTLTRSKWNPAFDEKAVLFSLDNKKYTALEFIQFVKQNQKPNRLAPAKYLEQQYEKFVEDRLMIAVEENISRKNPEFRWLVSEYYEGILLFDIMEKEVWTKASGDSVGQRKYYEANAAKYQAGERIRASVYSSTTLEHIRQLKGHLDKSDSVKAEEVLKNYKIRKEVAAFEKQDRQVFTKIPWKPGAYIAENNNLHYLIVVQEILQPGHKTFEEARPDVISDYQNQLEKTWVAQLKQKFPVKVDKKGKDLAIKKLLETKPANSK